MHTSETKTEEKTHRSAIITMPSRQTPQKIEALLNRFEEAGGSNAIDEFISGKLVLSKVIKPYWHEEKGIIYLNEPLVSNGTNGSGWIEHHANNKIEVDSSAQEVLFSNDFQATHGTKTNIAIVTERFFQKDVRMTPLKFYEHFKESYGFGKLTLEDTNLLRKKISDHDLLEGMKIHWIASMHRPVKIPSAQYKVLLKITAMYLDTFEIEPGKEWSIKPGGALAFSVPQ